MHIWELPDWPHFRWNAELLLNPLGKAHLKQGRLLGKMMQLGFELRLEAELLALTEEAVKSAEIEGERLDPSSVRSSVARRLGVPGAALGPEDRRTEGMVAMMLDATSQLDTPLTRERLYGWQAALFPTGYSGVRKIKTGGGGMIPMAPCKCAQVRSAVRRFTFKHPQLSEWMLRWKCCSHG